ncbi:hypothetical protein OE749_13645 [Aestuariibacter sp. AA17]|uniref:Uncharacterized protein n=1 Tax=Fluctibacter corallii TaxID=2984329 RepID=A0ABT3AAY0_9ALTE|nr:hypothetical protein [Aestuariibacter sp. AA17]MCV2885737.1 hypothetical protein [Aestuariibacter sp. AA17]
MRGSKLRDERKRKLNFQRILTVFNKKNAANEPTGEEQSESTIDSSIAPRTINVDDQVKISSNKRRMDLAIIWSLIFVGLIFVPMLFVGFGAIEFEICKQIWEQLLTPTVAINTAIIGYLFGRNGKN